MEIYVTRKKYDERERGLSLCLKCKLIKILRLENGRSKWNEEANGEKEKKANFKSNLFIACRVNKKLQKKH